MKGESNTLWSVWSTSLPMESISRGIVIIEIMYKRLNKINLSIKYKFVHCVYFSIYLKLPFLAS
jgi:hypothetical protein